ncbi:hypothetical protein RI129_005629 [Pyrocoelia pectoralis]|uniref:Transposase n=1 Tax=Pyrocoelia pectoralis TaxID=417401 RepID=A0AAN7VIV5_9COLE
MNPFRTTRTLIVNVHPQRRRTVRTEEVVAAIERSAEEDPNVSIRHRAQQLELCPFTTWKILRKDLGLRAYKMQLVQKLKPRDQHCADEAHFWLNGHVNEQNGRIWSEEIPEAFIETPRRYIHKNSRFGLLYELVESLAHISS